MKKVLFLALSLCLVSCELEDNSHPTMIMEKGLPFLGVTEFKYKEHSYIEFWDGSRAGVVHDPECEKCFQIFD